LLMRACTLVLSSLASASAYAVAHEAHASLSRGALALTECISDNDIDPETGRPYTELVPPTCGGLVEAMGGRVVHDLVVRSVAEHDMLLDLYLPPAASRTRGVAPPIVYLLHSSTRATGTASRARRRR